MDPTAKTNWKPKKAAIFTPRDLFNLEMELGHAFQQAETRLSGDIEASFAQAKLSVASTDFKFDVKIVDDSFRMLVLTLYFDKTGLIEDFFKSRYNEISLIAGRIYAEIKSDLTTQLFYTDIDAACDEDLFTLHRIAVIRSGDAKCVADNLTFNASLVGGKLVSFGSPQGIQYVLADEKILRGIFAAWVDRNALQAWALNLRGSMSINLADRERAFRLVKDYYVKRG